MDCDESKVEYLSEWPPPGRAVDWKEDGSDDDPTTGLAYSVDALLAAWWRKRSAKVKRPRLTESRSPKSLLRALKRLPEAKAMLEGEVTRLRKAAKEKRLTASQKLLMSSLLFDLEKYGEARDVCNELVSQQGLGATLSRSTEGFLREAEKLNELQKEILWCWRRARLQVEGLCGRLTFGGKGRAIPVERVSCRELDEAAFREKYVSRGIPVIVTDMSEEVCEGGGESWTLDFLSEVAGGKKVPLRKRIDDSAEWAKLETIAAEMSLAEFVDGVKGGTSDGRYLFDWSLPLFCPELSNRVTVPRYFRHDYLKRTSEGALYRNSWPSLFVTGAGTVSDLHVDAFGSNFWMYLFAGRKRWTFFRRSDLGKLRPRYFDSMDPAFDVDFSRQGEWDIDAFHLVLEPGEVLFVPHGTPHRVENLQDSIAVSGNFVDQSNVKEVVEHLKVNALLDPRAGDLLEELVDLDLASALF